MQMFQTSSDNNTEPLLHRMERSNRNNHYNSTPLYHTSEGHSSFLLSPPSQAGNANPQDLDLGACSHPLQQSVCPLSPQQLLEANDQQVLYASPDDILFNEQSPGEVRSRKFDVLAKFWQSMQFNVGKASRVALQGLMLLLLVCVLVILLVHLSSKDSCTSASDAASTSAGLISGDNGNDSLLQNNIFKKVAEHANDINKSMNVILQELQTSREVSIPTAAAINDILLVVNELLELQNGSSLFNSIRPVSCKDIKAVQPNSPTGYYHVNSRNIYCNMDVLCGVEGGGWTRLAHLDMSDNTQDCPSGFQEYSGQSIRVCIKYGQGCKSIRFPTNGIAYTQICGRVVGYQKGSTDGIRSSGDINSAYLDGVSITRGSPREHVWSYIAGLRSDMASSCPCSNGNNVNVPSFVGNNYYCESGTNRIPFYDTLYGDDPLWDGQRCPSLEAPCCTSPNLPWFHRDYGNATSTDYLELRVCCDQWLRNEAVPIKLYEIYIK